MVFYGKRNFRILTIYIGGSLKRMPNTASNIRVGVVGYRMGNIMSLRNAFEAIGADVFVADEAEQLKQATHLILPGVGAFPRGMEQLKTHWGSTPF